MTNPTQQYHFFATAPKGLTLLMLEELTQLGAHDAAEKLAGVKFTGDLELAYTACLWSRLANRILLQLNQVPVETPEELYRALQTISWDEHIDPSGTFAVQFVTSQSAITHTLFGAQKSKDAIVDQLRDRFGVRPSVDRERPDVSVYVYLHRDIATIYLDLSGESLHKRGYRLSGGAAPLKENLAAGLLLRAGWPAIAKEKGSLLDPMCGSGTLLIEGALIAADVAPGLLRNYFGLTGWKKHEPQIWQRLIDDARQRREEGMQQLPTIVGYDHNAEAVKIAFENIEKAGFRGKIHVEKRELAIFSPKLKEKPGLIIVNPPYGERLGEEQELESLYKSLGERLKTAFTGWQGAIFTGNPDLGKQMGIRAQRYYTLFNGAIPCKLLLFNLQPEYYIHHSPAADNERRIRAAQRVVAGNDNDDVQMFINRLRKNLRHQGRIAKRKKLSTYRVYDADIPEYAFIIDLSEEGAHVQEYQAPRSIDPKKVSYRQQQVLAVLPEILNLLPAQIFFNMQSLKSKSRNS
jgi:23S rRNA (guanine2445-N2)-methyltransferase / 23S rRNA (guanine2069-N7)-methyltransferase